MKIQWLLFFIIPISALADELIVSNVPNGCLASFGTDTFFVANFTPNQYQCSSGYYLPANTDGCVACPDYYDCPGGTLTFDKNFNQGATFKTQVTENVRNGCRMDFLGVVMGTADITATFTPNVHTCAAGYYMPANTDGCVVCPANNYCPGGTYTFNETSPQGLTPCDGDLVAPPGMWEVAQCGRMMHMGDTVLYLRSVRKTVPSLNFMFDTGQIFYANVTTQSVPVHAGTTGKLKISDGITVWTVYDDTVTLPE